jgi:hypothetical protein
MRKEMTMHQERKTLGITIGISGALKPWLKQLEAYGVPPLDRHDVPWPGKWARVTEDGSLFNRIEKWMFKEHGIKLYSQEKAALSNALAHSLVHAGHEVEINNDFNWAPGDYGDVKSCFWGGKRQAWAMLRVMGGAAMKVYNDKGQGVARCLVLPYKDESPILFNAFGYPLTHCSAIYQAVFQNRDEGEHATPITLTVDGDDRKPIHFNEWGLLMGAHQLPLLDSEGMVPHHNFDGSAYYNQTYRRYHLFCEMCYTRLEYVPISAVGSSLYKHSAHLCEECAKGDLSSERWVGVALKMHRRFEGEGDEDNGAHAPKLRYEVPRLPTDDERGHYIDYARVYTTTFMDEATLWQNDLLYGAPNTSKRHLLVLRLSNDGVYSEQLVERFVELVNHYCPERETNLEELRGGVAFAEVMACVQYERLAGRSDILKGMVKTCYEPSNADEVDWIRLAWASKYWDGSRNELSHLFSLTLDTCVNHIADSLRPRWTMESRRRWADSTTERRRSWIYRYIRDGIDELRARQGDE